MTSTTLLESVHAERVPAGANRQCAGCHAPVTQTCTGRWRAAHWVPCFGHADGEHRARVTA